MRRFHGILSHKCHENSKTGTLPRTDPVTKFSARDARFRSMLLRTGSGLTSLVSAGMMKNESSGAASGN